MNNDDIKKQLKELFPQYLEQKHGIIIKWDGKKTHKLFNDVFHEDKNPSAGLYRNGQGDIIYKCFSGSDPFTGDIFEFVGRELNTTDFKQQFNYLCEFFGIEPGKGNAWNYTRSETNQKQTKQEQRQEMQQQTTDRPQWLINYIERSKRRIKETEYMIKRGFTPETLERFNIGFDPQPVFFNEDGSARRHQDGNIMFLKGEGGNDGAIIYPYKNGFNRRMIQPEKDTPKAYKQKASAQDLGVWNEEAINAPGTELLYIVEGEADALTIEQENYRAVALGTTGNNNLKDLLKGVSYPVLIALDNDTSGVANTEKLINELKNAGLKHVYSGVDISGKHKDINERLQKEGRKSVKAALDLKKELIENVLKREKEKEIKAYLEESSLFGFMGEDFINDIETSKERPIPTGLGGLFDEALDGGLYPGVYTVASNSGQGKTTLAEQIVYNIAKTGKSVLYFSLEMPIKDILGKLISMRTYESARNKKDFWKYAKTAREVIAPHKYKNYSNQEKEYLKEIAQEVREVGKNLFFFWRIDGYNPQDIQNEIEKHQAITGKTPVILIDYFQILNAMDEAGQRDERLKANANIKYIKHIATKYNTPIISISAVNRTSYEDRIDTSALKESANIEYNSDIVIGMNYARVSAIKEYNQLQTQAKEKKTFNLREESRKEPRQMEIEILKGRLQATYTTIYCNYYPKYNYFEEVDYIHFEDINTICESLKGITADGTKTPANRNKSAAKKQGEDLEDLDY